MAGFGAGSLLLCKLGGRFAVGRFLLFICLALLMRYRLAVLLSRIAGLLKFTISYGAQAFTAQLASREDRFRLLCAVFSFNVDDSQAAPVA